MNRYAVNRPCVKCGATNAKTEYQDAVQALLGREGKYPLMKRTCQRCGYVWYELPIDSTIDFGEAARHIESTDSNAICLCGANLVDNGSGMYVCSGAYPFLKKEGAA